MRIGVVSDTHGHTEFTRPAVSILESCEVQQVIHCGDVGSAEIVRMFERWPTHFVFGNIDDARRLREAIAAAGQTCHERFGSLNLNGVRIAFLHGDDVALLGETVESGEWDLVCHGHTHVARQQRHKDTLVLNPGALYRANPHSFALVDLPQLEVTFVNV
jgi:uncharacterized protein